MRKRWGIAALLVVDSSRKLFLGIRASLLPALLIHVRASVRVDDHADAGGGPDGGLAASGFGSRGLVDAACARQALKLNFHSP